MSTPDDGVSVSLEVGCELTSPLVDVSGADVVAVPVVGALVFELSEEPEVGMGSVVVPPEALGSTVGCELPGGVGVGGMGVTGEEGMGPGALVVEPVLSVLDGGTNGALDAPSSPQATPTKLVPTASENQKRRFESVRSKPSCSSDEVITDFWP